MIYHRCNQCYQSKKTTWIKDVVNEIIMWIGHDYALNYDMY